MSQMFKVSLYPICGALAEEVGRSPQSEAVLPPRIRLNTPGSVVQRCRFPRV
jgi:hypothetical protein